MEQKYLDNLTKLADYLENVITDDQFDIENFRSDSFNNIIEFKNINDCGTIGCALGWAPFVNGLEAFESDYIIILGNRTLGFHNYSKRIFDMMLDNKFDFLFSDYWLDSPEETRLATVNRIRKFVKQDGELLAEDYDLMDVYGVREFFHI